VLTGVEQQCAVGGDGVDAMAWMGNTMMMRALLWLRGAAVHRPAQAIPSMSSYQVGGVVVVSLSSSQCV
jgi:hypothetical protein